MEQERKERIARNEASFRSINEDLEQGLHKVMRDEGELAGFVCECGHIDCATLVRLPLEAYEQIRRHPARFLIEPGHEIDGVEDVVEVGSTYAVVQKRPEVHPIVEATDPRGGEPAAR
jgi:hypothetical protein